MSSSPKISTVSAEVKEEAQALQDMITALSQASTLEAKHTLLRTHINRVTSVLEASRKVITQLEKNKKAVLPAWAQLHACLSAVKEHLNLTRDCGSTEERLNNRLSLLRGVISRLHVSAQNV
ncbi:hypothetical protein EIP91_005006 [Steccherinum ochraceum]|uniref:Uncharacterized protein n=1 Tax=Steccherinum ochraceum TaxID=92696 RepID=A0A4R0R7R9_9APHY|nr:hypothetical protein EIP91_005006 [Steccherinum ochraceum]